MVDCLIDCLPADWRSRVQARHAVRRTMLAVCLALVVGVSHAADEESAETESVRKLENLSSILMRHTRVTFVAVSRYVEKNPNTDDIDRSYAWLFETAQRNGYEADVLPLAEAYLKRNETDESTAKRARQSRVLGLAATGKMDEAMQGFEQEMKGVRLRSPNATVDFAIAVASQAQMANDFKAAGAVFERLASAFFLNPYVRSLSENRLYRLELANQPAPKLGAEDFDGKPVDISAYEGKVLLIDFWATNCAPCIEEFPALKQLYADYHDKGLEIVGISLDEQRESVDQFQETWKLPWRMTMSSTDGGATRARYRARTIPTMYLVDQRGRIVRVDVHGKNLRRSVELLLKAEK
jgi:thiol-disulfide isomerase/thioredoxin